MANAFDVIVIGAGPAGYVAAIRCAQLGLKTACIEKWLDDSGKPKLGGTCNNVGCIPSKALLDSSERFESMKLHGIDHGISAEGLSVDIPAMIARKDKIVEGSSAGVQQLFGAAGVELLLGTAKILPEKIVEITAADGAVSQVSAKDIVIATGSTPVAIPPAPLHEEIVVDNAGALAWTSVPQTLGVIGAGVIGLELGSVWRRLGAEVTIIEAQPDFLPMADKMIAKAALRSFQKQGLDIKLGALVKGTERTAEGVVVDYTDSKGDQKITVERLIVAVGRRPHTTNIAAGELELLFDERGFVYVNDNCETNVPGIWAIGDVVRGPMLAHKGSEEGVAVAERIAGLHGHVNYDAIPNVVYTHPELAWVGKTEEDIKSEGIEYKVGSFPFAASGRARAINETEGTVRVLARADNNHILGVHIFGPQASELLAQAVIAIEMQSTLDDLAATMFAHPTLSESLHEAVLSADNRAIHMANRKKR